MHERKRQQRVGNAIQHLTRKHHRIAVVMAELPVNAEHEPTFVRRSHKPTFDLFVHDQGICYSRTNGSGQFGTDELTQVEDIDGDGVPDPIVEAIHPRKGCQLLVPNRTDTIAKGQIRRMVVDGTQAWTLHD